MKDKNLIEWFLAIWNGGNEFEKRFSFFFVFLMLFFMVNSLLIGSFVWAAIDLLCVMIHVNLIYHYLKQEGKID